MNRPLIQRCPNVCVLDYGAVGDGKSDDAVAIQSAIDSGADRVVIPAGTFVIANVLRPRAGQCIEINGTLKVRDALIQPLQKDVQVGDRQVVVEDASQYRVGQWVTLYDEQLPIHLIDWVSQPDAVHGATYQTRRVQAGNARIAAIEDNTITLDAQSARLYLRSFNACLATQHSAILIEQSGVRICGTGVIDGNMDHQLDAQPAALDMEKCEDGRVGCGITVKAAGELTRIVIEDITVRNAILHNISLGNHNNSMFPGSLVSDSVIRNVRCLYAHDKNIVIGRCRDCSIFNNLAAYARYEDGIVFHQVGDDGAEAAYRITVQGNRCIGNARNGLHIGANMREIILADNLCADNGFNLVINGDDCTSSRDVATGYNGRLFPLAQHRPSVLIAGRRIRVERLTVLDSHGVGLGVSGQDIHIAGGVVAKIQSPGSGKKTAGIAICRGSSCTEALYPATGLQPRIVPRQAEVYAQAVEIRDMMVRGYCQSLQVQPGTEGLVLEHNDLHGHEHDQDPTTGSRLSSGLPTVSGEEAF